jgi:hypothetical protein
MGRLDDLRRTIDSVCSQQRSSYVLVDYACPDGSGRWARERYPDMVVTAVAGRARFHGAEARNQGAAAVDDDGIICFLDADVQIAQGFSDYVMTQIEEGVFLIPDRAGPGFDSMLVCRKADFDRVHGFDEAFLGWGEECADLRAVLRRAGVAERSFPATRLSPSGQHRATARHLCMVPDQETNRAIHAAYRRAKAAILDETGGHSISIKTRRAIYSAITRRHVNACGPVSPVPRAAVAFHEAMGYTVARLEIGVSSHNNDARPFTAVPEPLVGLPFTQVVASIVSPVEVEFLTAGKLYVLVGNDWEGAASATAWLTRTGFREGLPALTTGRGTGFDVWSLEGEAGERFVLPTQVMLVADHLLKV